MTAASGDSLVRCRPSCLLHIPSLISVHHRLEPREFMVTISWVRTSVLSKGLASDAVAAEVL